MLEPARTVEEVRHEFTSDEIGELSRQLVAATIRLGELQREKTSGLASMNSLIKEKEKDCVDLALKLTAGFELRPAEVLIVYDEPRPGMKRVIALATSEVIREERMTAEEMQQRLNFAGEP